MRLWEEMRPFLPRTSSCRGQQSQEQRPIRMRWRDETATQRKMQVECAAKNNWIFSNYKVLFREKALILPSSPNRNIVHVRVLNSTESSVYLYPGLVLFTNYIFQKTYFSQDSSLKNTKISRTTTKKPS